MGALYYDEMGKRRDLQRRADSRADAREIADKLAEDRAKTDGRSHKAEKMSFADLADYCEAHYRKQAETGTDERLPACADSIFKRKRTKSRPDQK